MKARLFGLMAAAAALASGPALAHHSFAMFDRDKNVTLNGTVKEFQWTNPHSWIQVNVPDASGALVEWSIECGSPNMLARQGWKSSVLKPGDKVAVLIHPMKDGTHGGSMVSVTLDDGRVLGQSGAAPAPKS
jgi:hypothetical protein